MFNTSSNKKRVLAICHFAQSLSINVSSNILNALNIFFTDNFFLNSG